MRIYIFAALSMIIVTIFFLVVLLIKNTVNARLTQSVKMNKDFAEFHFSINYLTCMQYSILSTWSPKVLDTEYFEDGWPFLE